MNKKQCSTIQVVLTVIFVAALMISNIISSRTFDFFGNTMTSAVFVFPITYILSDLFSEVYGYKWSRITCYLAFAGNLIMVGIFAIVNVLPTLPWMEETAGAFRVLLGGVNACTFASLIAYVVGDFANDKVFAWMKKSHENDMKNFGVRAILSSVVGEFLDSFIYLPLAFCVFNPIMSFGECVIMVLMQVGLKTGYEIIVLPLNRYVTGKVFGIEKGGC